MYILDNVMLTQVKKKPRCKNNNGILSEVKEDK